MNLGHVTAIAVGIAVACGATVSLAQYGKSDAQNNPPAPAPGMAKAPGEGVDMGDMLMGALKGTPGCLGVEGGSVESGKQVIFAFFKDRQAAMNWYNHPVHQQFVKAFPGRDPNYKPMQDVPEGVPVLAVASITFADKPAIEGSPIPFSQISIELFTPLSGGLSINGGFAPEAFRELVKQKN